MRKLLSTKYSAGAFNFALLILRLVVGIIMANHGYDKLKGFDEMAPKFMNFMGLGNSVSLGLLIFAEFFCSILIALGLLTRLACIPLIIATCVMVFKAHGGDVLETAQLPTLFLTAYLVLLFVGPGRVSVDGMIGK